MCEWRNIQHTLAPWPLGGGGCCILRDFYSPNEYLVVAFLIFKKKKHKVIFPIYCGKEALGEVGRARYPLRVGSDLHLILFWSFNLCPFTWTSQGVKMQHRFSLCLIWYVWCLILIHIWSFLCLSHIYFNCLPLPMYNS